ncbi:MAG: hypothetical protein KKB51_18675 [Candidatus Riflebacteria bacterium]|nr:hypothetical protein [Candidatus Riflebacteria bacterium]
MTSKLFNPFKVRFFSAQSFMARGILILIVFAILHLLGLREYTSFISGTTSGSFGDLLGISYFLAYSFALFVAPVLLIAAAFMKIFSRLAGAED